METPTAACSRCTRRAFRWRNPCAARSSWVFGPRACRWGMAGPRRASPPPSRWAVRCSTRPTARSASFVFSKPGPNPAIAKGTTCPSASLQRARSSSTRPAAAASTCELRLDPVAMRAQTKALTAIVGSYPKPRYVYRQNGRSLLDSFGFAFDRRQQELGPAEFARLLDKAALSAIDDQNRAGIDIMTDGEERRGHYVLHIVNKLDGIDSCNRKRISMRGGTTEQDAPRVIGKIKYNGSMVLEEFLFTRKHAQGIAKIGLPGPSTVADCVADEHYQGERKQLAFDYADAIHHEVEALIAAGCEIIQFDDPVLLRYPEAAQAWGLEALERCFAGLENQATFVVHICCGYPNKPLERKGIS